MKAAPSIWWFAFGYFACYAPYSALTKAISKGLIRGVDGGVSGFTMLPCTVLCSLVGMAAFISAMGWWKHATQYEIAGLRIPGPRWLTLASGLCTAVIVGTTTLAYTFTGTSIVFMMLLMRGGVLVIAPIVDLVSGRRCRWFSWVALVLSIGALFVNFSSKSGYAMTLVSGLDVAAYLAGYFVRLRIMSAKAKSDDPQANLRFFVEEQMVATPAVLLVLGVGALIGRGEILEEIRAGFTSFFLQGRVVPWTMLVGVLSQGTGIFGGLILLDKRENTFSVPVNRCSSVLAGLVAAWLLTVFFDSPPSSGSELVGAALIVVAILFLSIPPMLHRSQAPPVAPTGKGGEV